MRGAEILSTFFPTNSFLKEKRSNFAGKKAGKAGKFWENWEDWEDWENQ